VAGVAKSLFQGPYFRGQAARTYDVSPDGRRFLMIKAVASSTGSTPLQLVVVQNFFEELKRLVPVP
jgi:hypothetical protein